MTQKWIKNGVFADMTMEINGRMVSNPTDEMLREAGYVPYVPSDAELLSQAKDAKTLEIDSYDRSSVINSFMLGGTEMWLSFDERARIRQSIDAYRNEGKTEMTKWFNGKAFTFTLDTWQTMLNKLSVYASEALNVTERHKAEVKALTSIEAVEKYDYKTGYPKRLQFDNTPDAVITK